MNVSNIFTNGTFGKSDGTQKTTFNPVIAIFIIIVTGLTAIVNLIFIVVCFRTLKKKFHNLLVLTLCFSDFLLAVSILCFCLSSVSESIQTNVDLCRFHFFTIFYGFATTYSTVFLLCFERFLIVRSRNFGTSHFLDRFKYVIIGLTLGLDFLLTFPSTYFIPQEETIESCRPPNLYTDEYIRYAEIWVTSITLILVLIVVALICTNYLLWKIFFKGRIEVAPTQETGYSSNIDVGLQRDDQLSEQLPRTSESVRQKTNHSESPSAEDKTTDTGDRNDIIEPNAIRLDNLVTVDTPKHYTQPNSLNYNQQRGKPKQIKLDAWEKQAFASSFIIAFVTVIFTFPFICSFWYDMFSESLMSKDTRFILVIPVLIISILNPFIYAWRTPEIREEFRKLLNLNN